MVCHHRLLGRERWTGAQDESSLAGGRWEAPPVPPAPAPPEGADPPLGPRPRRLFFALERELALSSEDPPWLEEPPVPEEPP